MDLTDALQDEMFIRNLDNQNFEACYEMLAEAERYQLARFLVEESLDPLKDLDYIPDVLFSHLSFETFNIPDRIKKIGKHSFSHNDELEYITLPDNIELIQSYAFYNCKNLKEINIPQKVKKISFFCFGDCESLEEITLPEGIKTIEPWAFSSCLNLKKIYLPKSLEQIEAAAFNGCKNLKDIFYAGTIEEWKRVFKGKSIFRDVPTRLAKCSDGKGLLRQ